jgi:hypothetical protein
VQALSLTANIFKEARDRGYTKMNLLDIGGGFPAPYDDSREALPRAREGRSTRELDRLFPEGHPDPGRAGPVPRGRLPAPRLPRSSARPCATARRCYYINDGVYHTYSGVIFDHCKYPVKAFKKGPTQLCSVFGPTCDALDVVSMAENLPRPRTRRPRVQRQHRRLQPRQRDLLQRLPAGQGRARKPLAGKPGAKPESGLPSAPPARWGGLSSGNPRSRSRIRG